MAKNARQLLCLVFCCVVSVCLVTAVDATISWNVTFEDSSESFVDFYDDISSHTIAAGNEWSGYMDASLTASLEVIVHFDPNVPTANGGSVTSDFVENNVSYNVFQQGATAEILSGVDPNGSDPDIILTYGVDYLTTELWFYPDPFNRTEEVPSGKTEAYASFAHELGHALAFNGWRDSFDGTLPGDFASPFDVLTTFDGSEFFFDGAAASDIYGGPVPLTFGNHNHVGNEAPRPGEDLVGDLMNGVVFFRGTKYEISPLDLAIAQDAGVPIVDIPNSFVGDFDDDSDVDGNDFLAWQRGDSPISLSQSDLNNWEQHYGETVSLATNSIQIAEPATGLMLSVAIVLIGSRSKR